MLTHRSFECPIWFERFITLCATIGLTGPAIDWVAIHKAHPLLREYVKTLPFKVTGRIMLFCTYPGAGVAIHRDWIMQEHSDHNIDLFFNDYRPSFIWDEKKKEKIYLENGAKSYFFNNRDYHGVDAETTFRYTLRIVCTFTDELCNELGLINGKTWSQDYAI